MNEASTPTSKNRLQPQPVFAAVAALANLVAPAIIEAGAGGNTLAVLLLFAAVVAEFGLLAVWAVFGPERWIVRLPLVFFTAAALHGIFVLGMVAAKMDSWAVEAYTNALLLMPLVFVAMQTPLWIARLALGCRLVLEADVDEIEPSRAGQFSIQHMLAATAIAALALGLAQTGVSVMASASFIAPTQFWIGVSIACAIAMGLGLLAVLPVVWAAFLFHSPGAGAVIVVVYSIASFILTPVFIMALAGGGSDPEAFVVSFWFHAGGMGTLLGGLFAVRACGYRMVRQNRVGK